MDLNRRFVKFDGTYHLITLQDVQFYQTNNRWPGDYQEINWDEEIASNNFVAVKDFLHFALEDKRAYTLAVLANYLGVPVIKVKVDASDYPLVNTYPRYWLHQMLADKISH